MEAEDINKQTSVESKKGPRHGKPPPGLTRENERGCNESCEPQEPGHTA